jgi:hypothetical protein
MDETPFKMAVVLHTIFIAGMQEKISRVASLLG